MKQPPTPIHKTTSPKHREDYVFVEKSNEDFTALKLISGPYASIVYKYGNVGFAAPEERQQLHEDHYDDDDDDNDSGGDRISGKSVMARRVCNLALLHVSFKILLALPHSLLFLFSTTSSH